MSKDLIEIEYIFPDISGVRSKDELISEVLKDMKTKDLLDYSGYLDQEALREDLEYFIGSGEVNSYRILGSEESNKVSDLIRSTILEVDSVVSLPTKNFVFVLPFLPDSGQLKDFGGVMGVAPYSCVFYLFVSPGEWTETALKETVAHEVCHTIFNYNNYDSMGSRNLLDEIIMEGLAENFREHILGGETAPWSLALSEEEVQDFLKKESENLGNTDKDIINKVLFGGGDYKRWTGYSVGYYLVKDFIKNNPEVSWQEILKMRPRDFLN